MKKIMLTVLFASILVLGFVGCDSAVDPPSVKVSAISVDKTTLTLTAGGATGTITATVEPSGATNKTVTWSSSSEAVATVAGGVVTPLTAGTTTITATTVDGSFTATCEVTVNAQGLATATAGLFDIGTVDPFFGNVSVDLTLNHEGKTYANVESLEISLYNGDELLATNKTIVALTGTVTTSPFLIGRTEAVDAFSWHRGAYPIVGALPTENEIPNKVVATYVIGGTTYVSESEISLILPNSVVDISGDSTKYYTNIQAAADAATGETQVFIISGEFKETEEIHFNVQAMNVTLNGVNGAKIIFDSIASGYAWPGKGGSNVSGFNFGNEYSNNVKPGTTISFEDIDFVNDKTSAADHSTKAMRGSTYIYAYAETVNYTNINVTNGGLVVYGHANIDNSTFAIQERDSKEVDHYALFLDNEYGGEPKPRNYSITNSTFTVDETAYGVVKIADDKNVGANLTFNKNRIENNVTGKGDVYVNGTTHVIASENTFSKNVHGEIYCKENAWETSTLNGITFGDLARGYGNVNGTYEVWTAAGLAAAIEKVEDGDVTIKITSDLDGNSWASYTVDGYKGAGIISIDGNNHTINNLKSPLIQGTWAGKSGVVIKNLTIDKANMELSTNYGTGAGAFISWPQASQQITLDNVHLTNSTINGGYWTGGLVGYANGYSGNDGPVFENIEITNCSVVNNTISGIGSVGGVIGHAMGDAWTKITISNTEVRGNTITSTGNSDIKAGIVMGTVGAGGPKKTVNGVTHKGGAYINNLTESNNTVKSNNVTIDRLYGRQGTPGGELYVNGEKVVLKY